MKRSFRSGSRLIRRRLAQALLRARVAWAVVVLVAAALSVPLALGVDLDLSFAPLFSEDADRVRVTQSIREDFGELGSGAVGVVFEADDVLAPSALRAIDELGRALAAHEETGLVVSVTRLSLLGEGKDALLLSPVVDTAATDENSWRRSAERLRAARARSEGQVSALLDAAGETTVVWADVTLPLEDLEGRRLVVAAIERDAERLLAPHGSARLVGYSVVEAAYERVLLRGAAKASAVTALLLALLVGLLFRQLSVLALAFAGVGLGLPLTLAAMRALSLPITLVSASLPTLLLMVGVAGAIHMLEATRTRRARGESKLRAVRGMMREVFWPCTLTSLTTAAGFVSLTLAGLPIIRDFGLAVAIGVLLVHALTCVMVPALLLSLPFEGRESAGRRDGLLALVFHVVVKHPRAAAVVPAVAFGTLALFAARLDVVQHFNEDVPAAHPVRAAQAHLEERFGGFLGPEVRVVRADGGAVLDEEVAPQLQRLAARLREIADVQRVTAVTDAIPEDVPPLLWSMAFDVARADPFAGPLLRAQLNDDESATVLGVRVGDIGTVRALLVVDEVERAVAETLSPPLRGEVGGGWVLAQTGMSGLLRDMTTSFAGALLLVLPFLWLAAGRVRLLVVALVPNLVPMVCALGVMGLCGISLRIGTAVVFAIALGIAVDDTIHVLVGLRREGARTLTPKEAVARALASSGRAVLTSSVVLVVGFLSLALTDLLAIRDMGLVGAAALALALVADVVWLPALYLVSHGRRGASAQRGGREVTLMPLVRQTKRARVRRGVARRRARQRLRASIRL